MGSTTLSQYFTLRNLIRKAELTTMAFSVVVGIGWIFYFTEIGCLNKQNIWILTYPVFRDHGYWVWNQIFVAEVT